MITKKNVHKLIAFLNKYMFGKNSNYLSITFNQLRKNFDVRIAIWSIGLNGIVSKQIKFYTNNICSEKDIDDFIKEVDSTIDNYIKIAIDETNKNKENGNRT